MPPRERTRRALTHEETRFRPYGLSFPPDLRQHLVEYTGDPDFDQDLIQHLAYMGSGCPDIYERVDDRRY